MKSISETAAPASIKQVARAAGVSAATVSRVLNPGSYVSTATRLRVEQAIASLEYHPAGSPAGCGPRIGRGR